MTSTMLSEHFSLEEMKCPHCVECLIKPEFLVALEQLRALGPEPIIIHDAYRCREHNEQVGGVPNSEHLQGIAADLNISGLTLQQMYDRAIQVPAFDNGGIGVYDTDFIHVDSRSGKARWSRVRGIYLGIDQLVEVKHNEYGP